MRVLRQLEVLAKRQATRIGFKAKGSILLLDLADIVAVQAEGNYVSLRHRTNPYLVRESLSSIAEKLKPYGFIRIHRSVVVNISAVEKFQPLPTGEYSLRVKGGKEYLVTRKYKHNLRDLAQLWVGSERLCGYPSQFEAKLGPNPQRTNGDHRRNGRSRRSSTKVDSAVPTSVMF